MMTEPRRWLNGFATAAALLGVRDPDELAAMLPEGTPLPTWWRSFHEASTSEARAARLAPRAMRLRTTILDARPRWH